MPVVELDEIVAAEHRIRALVRETPLERSEVLSARIGGGWCQSHLAEDVRGRQVEPWAESARRWSLLGALLGVWVEARCPSGEVLETAYAALALATGGRPEEWNSASWRTSRHVLSAFRRARENVPAARRQLSARSTERGWPSGLD